MPAIIAVLLALGVLLMLGLAFRRSARSRRMLRKLNQKFEDGQKIEEIVEEIFEEEVEDLAQRSAGAASPADAKTWQFELPDIDLALIEAALHANFPHLDWPKLPELRLHELQLPKINWATLWPAAPSLAFLVNLLRTCTAQPHLADTAQLGSAGVGLVRLGNSAYPSIKAPCSAARTLPKPHVA